MSKSKEELNELKKQYEEQIEKVQELSLEDLEQVCGGADSMKFAGKSVPLPPAKSKKLIDGGYAGKEVM